MSRVFQNIDPPFPSPHGECVPSAAPPLLGGEDTLAGRRGGWWVNSLEGARIGLPSYSNNHSTPWSLSPVRGCILFGVACLVPCVTDD
jgi:hypothetical protein